MTCPPAESSPSCSSRWVPRAAHSVQHSAQHSTRSAHFGRSHGRCPALVPGMLGWCCCRCCCRCRHVLCPQLRVCSQTVIKHALRTALQMTAATNRPDCLVFVLAASNRPQDCDPALLRRWVESPCRSGMQLHLGRCAMASEQSLLPDTRYSHPAAPSCGAALIVRWRCRRRMQRHGRLSLLPPCSALRSLPTSGVWSSTQTLMATGRNNKSLNMGSKHVPAAGLQR